MKSLDQIASTGIAINATNTLGNASYEFVIGSAGSYYLTGNLSVAKPNGISVAAAGVTIDLNGFQISRSSGSGGSAIEVNSISHSCTIKNGSIAAVGANTFAYGVLCDQASTLSGSLLDLAVSGVSASNGRGLSVGSGWVLERCRVHGCSDGAGILAGTGSTLSHCVVYGNTVTNGITTGEACTLDHCVVYASTSTGINANNGSVLIGCVANGNDGDGIRVANHVTIRSCSASNNQGNGIVVLRDCLISDCVTNLNGTKNSPFNTASDGIEITERTRVVNCEAFGNAQDGINCTSTNNRNYIEGCLVQGNTGFGIALAGAGNTVIKNQVGGNTGGSINQTGSNIAPIQNASDAAGTMHPLANFP